MTDLLELARRCEAATGPDRELDAAIWTAVLGNEQYWSLHERGGEVCLRYYPGPPGPEYHILKRYTASLDAALTLVPTEYAAWVSMNVACAGWFVTLLRRYDDIGTRYDEAQSRAGSFPLSVCAAALRARAALADQSS